MWLMQKKYLKLYVGFGGRMLLRLKLYVRICNYSFEICNSSLQPWKHFRIHKVGVHKWYGPSYGKHVVAGPFSLVVGQPHLVPVTCCQYCFEEIGYKSVGDESWHYCAQCEGIEPGTVELTTEQYEAYHG